MLATRLLLYRPLSHPFGQLSENGAGTLTHFSFPNWHESLSSRGLWRDPAEGKPFASGSRVLARQVPAAGRLLKPQALGAPGGQHLRPAPQLRQFGSFIAQHLRGCLAGSSAPQRPRGPVPGKCCRCSISAAQPSRAPRQH